MKKILAYQISLIALIAVVLLVSFRSPNGKIDEHILVEIYEVPNYADKGIHIHYGGSKTEVIPFKEFNKDNHDENGELIIATINRLEREGYDLTHIGSGLANNGMITKIFMVKR